MEPPVGPTEALRTKRQVAVIARSLLQPHLTTEQHFFQKFVCLSLSLSFEKSCWLVCYQYAHISSKMHE